MRPIWAICTKSGQKCSRIGQKKYNHAVRVVAQRDARLDALVLHHDASWVICTLFYSIHSFMFLAWNSWRCSTAALLVVRPLLAPHALPTWAHWPPPPRDTQERRCSPDNSGPCEGKQHTTVTILLVVEHPSHLKSRLIIPWHWLAALIDDQCLTARGKNSSCMNRRTLQGAGGQE